MAFRSPFSLQNMQLPGVTSRNTEGLGLPGGKVMFNLPRFQMPGTTASFPGSINMGGAGGMGGGMGGGMAPSLKFSITRSASSDPVQNILNDIQNPLGGANVNIGEAAPKQPSATRFSPAMPGFMQQPNPQSGFMQPSPGMGMNKFMQPSPGMFPNQFMQPSPGMENSLRTKMTSLPDFDALLPFLFL